MAPSFHPWAAKPVFRTLPAGTDAETCFGLLASTTVVKDGARLSRTPTSWRVHSSPQGAKSRPSSQSLGRLIGDRDSCILAEYIRNAQGWLERTQARYPDLFNDRNVKFVVSDIAEGMGQLASEGFDLAYCSNVLYYMKSDIRRLQAAGNTMAQVVKPGGWVIADESIELDRQLEEAGLEKAIPLENIPESVYCYRKPLTVE